MNLEGQIIKIAGVTLKGEALDGAFPLVRVDEEHVVVLHPVYGNIKVPRARSNLPASAPVTLTYEELTQEIRSRFQLLDTLVDRVANNDLRSLIVSGPPGIGKSHTTRTKMLAAVQSQKIRKYIPINGTLSALGFFIVLWENRQPGDVIHLDDSDDLTDDQTGCNLVKHATDSSEVRTVSYVKEAYALDKIPKTFNYGGSLIVGTNKDLEAEGNGTGKNAKHVKAIVDRALYLDLSLHSTQALMCRVEDCCRTTDILTKRGLDEAGVDTVINWLKDNSANLRSLSLRTAEHVAGHLIKSPDNWKTMAKHTLLRAGR